MCVRQSPSRVDSLWPRDCSLPGSSSTDPLWFVVIAEWVFACIRMHRTGNRFLFWGKSVGKCQVSVLQFLDILELLIPETGNWTLEAGLVNADRSGAASHSSAFWLGSVTSAVSPDMGSWAGRPRGHPQARRLAWETWREERIQVRTCLCLQTLGCLVTFPGRQVWPTCLSVQNFKTRIKEKLD